MRKGFLILPAVIALQFMYGCKGDTKEVASGLEERATQRKTEMLENVKQCYSNADKGDFVTDATQRLNDEADSLQSKVGGILDGDALAAYKAERASYEEWLSFQQTVSEEVIGDIWELFVGGSAGGSFQTIHLYDIANANAAEQAILYEALANKTLAHMSEETASLEQLDSARIALTAVFENHYSQYENIGPDGWPCVHYSPEQISALLDKDMSLFKEWMANRAALEPFLEKDVRKLFASHTSYWMQFCLRKYKERFISE